MEALSTDILELVLECLMPIDIIRPEAYSALVQLFSHQVLAKRMSFLANMAKRIQKNIRPLVIKVVIRQRIERRLLADVAFRKKFLRLHYCPQLGPHICIQSNIHRFYTNIYGSRPRIKRIFSADTLRALMRYIYMKALEMPVSITSANVAAVALDVIENTVVTEQMLAGNMDTDGDIMHFFIPDDTDAAVDRLLI